MSLIFVGGCLLLFVVMTCNSIVLYDSDKFCFVDFSLRLLLFMAVVVCLLLLLFAVSY